jgi:hypothetical protein
VISPVSSLKKRKLVNRFVQRGIQFRFTLSPDGELSCKMWDPSSYSLHQVQKKNINQVLQEPLQQPIVLAHQENRRKVGIDINEFQKITAMAGKC